MFPELQDAHSRLRANRVILDAEVIGYDKKTGKLLPFQETITRRRKHDVGEKAADVPVRFYIFDILLKDDQSLIDEKLQTRKDVLKNLFKDNEVLLQTPYQITDDPEKLRSQHHQFLAENLEGAVAKKIDSGYISGRKGWAWVKIKEEEGTLGKLSDTLDLIIMGYNVGKGKRAQFGLGTVLAGALDEEQNVVTIAKIGTGMTESQLQQIKQLCDDLVVKDQPTNYQVHKDLRPDFWVKPELVIEVAADELTNSPKHTAGQALRFPRLVKIRSDKSWDQATTLQELTGIH
jgi:DNA ligase-1